MTEPLRVAVDIGGTFTDTVLMRGADAVVATAKTLTTHSNPADGALVGVQDALRMASARMDQISGLVHGTTLATNALIERRGARTAVIATQGFRDVLEIAYERRYAQYDIDLEKPDYIVPRSRCFTVPERISVHGKVLKPLDETAVAGLIQSLDACETDSVAICLLHAYASPIHERRLAELLGQARPDLAISISSEVSPEAREFDRTCTTVCNAYVQPMMTRYLGGFQQAFTDAGLQCPILMMTAGGGMTTLETARRYPIRLVESGPAGGALLAARTAQACGADQVLSLDIGGTTAKLCLIDDGRPQTARRFEIGRAERFIKGSGMPVRIPVIEMIEIGAGGGSIASVDRMGRLNVGPQSAGSEPGPAAFGRGGDAPTVTDSDVMLGLIDPQRFAEGRLVIDAEAAERALGRGIGAALGIDPTEAARGISGIVDENMASAARIHAAESGKDIARRVMIAFGGNGPLHATRVADRVGVRHIIVPCDPGVGSAVGFLHAPVAFEIVRSLHRDLEALDPDELNTFLATMIAEAEAVVRLSGHTGSVETRRTAFMRYRGQGHEIEVGLPDRDLDPDDLPKLRGAFEAEYRRQFSRPVPGMVIEILNWGVRVATPELSPPMIAPPVGKRPRGPQSRRTVHLRATPDHAAVFERAHLCEGDAVSGPALIVEPQTTTLVGQGWQALVDGSGNLHLHRCEEAGT